MSDWAGDRDLGFSFQNVKGGRAVFALSANNFTGFEMPTYDGVAVQAQKCSRDALEKRQLLQHFERNRLGIGRPCDARLRDELVCESARRTGHHTLTARNARRIAHRRVVIESNAGGDALAHASQNKIFTDVAATADTAIAQDAGVKVDGDAH